eukprot:scaffold17621_cov95-Isochrysis_galbana.AAC.4
MVQSKREMTLAHSSAVSPSGRSASAPLRRLLPPCSSCPLSESSESCAEELPGLPTRGREREPDPPSTSTRRDPGAGSDSSESPVVHEWARLYLLGRGMRGSGGCGMRGAGVGLRCCGRWRQKQLLNFSSIKYLNSCAVRLRGGRERARPFNERRSAVARAARVRAAFGGICAHHKPAAARERTHQVGQDLRMAHLRSGWAHWPGRHEHASSTSASNQHYSTGVACLRTVELALAAPGSDAAASVPSAAGPREADPACHGRRRARAAWGCHGVR